MLFFKRHSVGLLALILSLLLAACGGGGGSTTNTGSSLSRIEITPSQPSLAKGTTLKLTATGIYSDNSTRTLTDDVSWLSADDSIASLSADGEISALAAGQVTLHASLDGISSSTELLATNAVLSQLELNPSSVQLAKGTRELLSLIGHYSDGSTQDVAAQASWTISDTSIASLPDPLISTTPWLTGLMVGNTQINASLNGISVQLDVTVSAAELVQIIINPDNVDLPLGTTLTLSARGLYSDGSSQILTQQANWSSADTGTVTVDQSGLIQPLSIGSTTVTASLAGIASSRTINVSNAMLTAIEVNAPSDSLPLGNSQPLLALGHYSDGSLQDITEQVVWQSTPAELLAISNAAGSRGLTTALVAGDVTITATLGEITGSLALSSSAATLTSIDVSPLNARLAIGTHEEFSATGRYSDGSIQDLSELVSWATTDAAIASISNADNEQGQTIALTPDSTTTVTATLGDISGTATLVTTAAQLLSINVLPAELTLPAGLQQTLSAEGNFSDGSIQVLDDLVSWESDTPGIATINNGALTGLQAGSTRISAKLGDISGNTTITINSATLNSLQINPGSQTLAINTQAQLQALALYSDGSQWDVTTQVTWSSDDSALLHVDNSSQHHGQISTFLSGNVTVTVALAGMQASATVNIANASLTDLRIIAARTSLDSGEHLQLTAMGDFSDGSSQDLTTEVVWSSTAPALASISNNNAQRGLLIAGINLSGTAIITATHNGFSPSLNLTINNTPLRPASLVVIATPNVIRNDGADTSLVEIRVQAASPNATIADGTVVDLRILQNGIELSNTPLITSGGIASTNFTTTDTGLLQIEASIAGSSLSNSTALYASPTIYDVIAGAAFADAQINGTLIQAGSRFGFFLFNLSNRDFPLLRYELWNGPDLLASTTDLLVLNGNLLTGGLKIGIIISIDDDITDQGVEARYYLTDPATGAPFYFSVTFTAP